VSVLHPGLLAAGLAAVALPILIHILFRRRRRPVSWGAMRFVIEAYRRQRRRLRLEQLLLLAARCLLIALVGVALARPIFGGSPLQGTGPLDLYLLIDDSLTASLQGEDGVSALDRHKRRATELLERLDPARGDRAGLITLASPPHGQVLPGSSDLDAVAASVERLTAAASAVDLEAALSRLRTELEAADESSSRAIRVVLLSDLYAGSVDTERTLPTLGESARLSVWSSRPRQEPAENLTIVSLRPLRSVLVGDGSTPAELTLRRSGAAASRDDVSQVRIRMVGVEREGIVGDATVRWRAGQREATVPISIVFEATRDQDGGALLRAEIDADPIAADNTFRLPVRVREAIRVGIVAPKWSARPTRDDPLLPADWFTLALSPLGETGELGSEGIDITRVDPASLDGPRLATLDAVIVVRPDLVEAAGWERLARYARGGGLVVATPPRDTAASAWSDLLLESFGLGWSIDPSPVELGEEGAALATERPGIDPSLDLLGMIASELADLAGPVRVHRLLEVEIPPAAPGSPLLTLADGRPVLVVSPPPELGASGRTGDEAPRQGAGLVVLLTTAIAFEWTDLPARPLIVPLLQEIVRQGVGLARTSGAQVAGRPVLAPPGTRELRGIDGAVPAVVSVDSRGYAASPVRTGGAWRALDDRGAVTGHVAVNADPRAGRTDPVAPGEIERWLGQVTPERPFAWLDEEDETTRRTTVESGDEARAGAGFELSTRLLVAAAIIAVIELVLARIFTHVGGSRGAAT